jgi:hypothetical protein
MSILLSGGCVMLVVTLVAWLGEMLVLASLGAYRGILSLGIGLSTGLLAAFLAWQPCQAEGA